MLYTGYSHGGDWSTYMELHGTQPLDFSASISPLGTPQAVKDAVCIAAGQCDRYPDPNCRELRHELSGFHNIPKEYIFCGNGSSDILYRLVLALRPKNALITAPAFSEYEQALETTDCVVHRYMLSEKSGFEIDGRICDAITPQTDVVFLCQPNNPTGIVTPKEIVLEILEKCTETGAFLVVDECFLDFLNDEDEYTMTEQCAGHENLLILKAFTKLYGMAGIRLGYCLCSNKDLIDRIRKCGQPWAVSTIAQKAGVEALHQKQYVQSVRRLISTERKWLKEQLEGFGFKVIDGRANYLLFKAPEGLSTQLESEGILIRSCVNFYGLNDEWYRTAVRTRRDNMKLIEAIREVMR